MSTQVKEGKGMMVVAVSGNVVGCGCGSGGGGNGSGGKVGDELTGSDDQKARYNVSSGQNDLVVNYYVTDLAAGQQKTFKSVRLTPTTSLLSHRAWMFSMTRAAKLKRRRQGIAHKRDRSESMASRMCTTGNMEQP